jgi:hypothetical protein
VQALLASVDPGELPYNAPGVYLMVQPSRVKSDAADALQAGRRDKPWPIDDWFVPGGWARRCLAAGRGSAWRLGEAVVGRWARLGCLLIYEIVCEGVCAEAERRWGQRVG